MSQNVTTNQKNVVHINKRPPGLEIPSNKPSSRGKMCYQDYQNAERAKNNEFAQQANDSNNNNDSNIHSNNDKNDDSTNNPSKGIIIIDDSDYYSSGIESSPDDSDENQDIIMNGNGETFHINHGKFHDININNNVETMNPNQNNNNNPKESQVECKQHDCQSLHFQRVEIINKFMEDNDDLSRLLLERILFHNGHGSSLHSINKLFEYAKEQRAKRGKEAKGDIGDDLFRKRNGYEEIINVVRHFPLPKTQESINQIVNSVGIENVSTQILLTINEIAVMCQILYFILHIHNVEIRIKDTHTDNKRLHDLLETEKSNYRSLFNRKDIIINISGSISDDFNKELEASHDALGEYADDITTNNNRVKTLKMHRNLLRFHLERYESQDVIHSSRVIHDYAPNGERINSKIEIYENVYPSTNIKDLPTSDSEDFTNQFVPDRSMFSEKAQRYREKVTKALRARLQPFQRKNPSCNDNFVRKMNVSDWIEERKQMVRQKPREVQMKGVEMGVQIPSKVQRPNWCSKVSKPNCGGKRRSLTPFHHQSAFEPQI